MGTITITLTDEEFSRLAELALHDGTSPVALATQFVRDILEDDAQWEQHVREAIAEIERGEYLTYDELRASVEETLAVWEKKASS